MHDFFPALSVPKSEAFGDAKYTVNCKGPCQNVTIKLDVNGDVGDADLFARYLGKTFWSMIYRISLNNVRGH